MSDKETNSNGNRRRATQRRTRTAKKGGRGIIPILAMIALALGAIYSFYQSPWSVQQVTEKMVATFDPDGVEEVTLYFADPKWTRLVPETRTIKPEADAALKIRALVASLAEGPRQGGAPILPTQAALRQVYLGTNGLAVIDFEPNLDELRSVGATGEMLTIFALVHTIVNNIDGISSVQILVGGQEQETLGGHVSISEPLKARPDLVEEELK